MNRKKRIVISGVAITLSSRNKDVLPTDYTASQNVQRIIEGEMFISEVPEKVQEKMLEKNLIKVIKHKDGTIERKPIGKSEEHIHLYSSIGNFDLTRYGVASSIVNTMDRAVQLAIASGLDALKDAGIVTGIGENTSGWVIPESMQNSTGIIYAASFPALETTIEEVERFYNPKTIEGLDVKTMFIALRTRLEKSLGNKFSYDSIKALKDLENLFLEGCKNGKDSTSDTYEFDRKFLLRILVLGNAQLAQIIKAKGPNMQTNAACASTTQAMSIAYDMIQVGRAERMVIIAGDNASSDTLMPWIGNGFHILGAACTKQSTDLGCMPFSKNRSGMILGSGGIGIILETEDGARHRLNLAMSKIGIDKNLINNDDIMQHMIRKTPFHCRLLCTHVSNSAYHGLSLDRNHIAEEMERFIASAEQDHGITRAMIAKNGVYLSHETSTHSSPTASCASNEIYALRQVFGKHLSDLLILNTKGFTGHAMGVSFEDVVAVEVLVSGKVPPIANFKEVDENLGINLKMSKGGDYSCKYAMRLSVGFGSQIALALYGTPDT